MKKILLTLLGLILTFSLLAKGDLPDPMQPHRMVNDFTGLFSESEKSTLEHKLRQFNDTTSTQIYIVTIDDLKGYDISDYATQLAENWGIGQKGKDNGVLILVKNKTSSSSGRVFITTGYGLEGVIPDIYAKRIIENDIIPNFRLERYYEAMDAATTSIMRLASGEFMADPEEDDFFGTLVILILILILFFVLSKKGGNGNSGGRGGGRYFPTGGFGGSFSGGGRGFGGGGGGSFGGGGAGGKW